MSTRRERAIKRRGWVQAANGRNGLVPRCGNCGDFGDPGFYMCAARPAGDSTPTEEAT